MTYELSAMHTAAMLDYECLNCSWVKAHILDESIVVKKIWGWAFKSSLYLEKWESYGDFSIYFIIWRPCWFSVRGGRWEFYTILFDILTIVNVGIDTKTKSLGSLTRKIYVIEWFHLIIMLIRPIKKNAPDKKFSIQQFPSPEHPYIAFPS